jgi:uncharacterized membrane protein YbjE (DUF340 family)
VSFDPFLYVAFGAGFLAGRLVQWRSPWVGHAATATVAVLLFLLGVSLGALPLASALTVIPLALAFTFATLAITIGIAWSLSRTPEDVPLPAEPSRTAALAPFAFLAAVGLGVVAGHTTGAAPGPWTEYSLFVLLALVGFDLTIELRRLRTAGVPIASALAGGAVVAVVFTVVGLVPAPAAFATASAFGWYSLAGPLVAARLGASLGLFAFLANFFRENVTMVSSAWLGRRIGANGLSAMGGATAMDTTLYFITRYAGVRSATTALATGFVLTAAAGVLVPLALSLA